MRKLLVILDLDETLIHATVSPHRTPDFSVADYGVFVRPGLPGFLQELLARYEVGIWTASSESYATEIVARIISDQRRLLFAWTRERCVQRRIVELDEWVHIKDLNKVKRSFGRTLDRVVIVDDSPEVAQRQYGNLVRVSAFEGEEDDRVLPLLRRYLRTLDAFADVRPVEKRGWRSTFESEDGPVRRLEYGRTRGCYVEFQCQPRDQAYTHWQPNSLFLEDEFFDPMVAVFASNSGSFNRYGATSYAENQLGSLIRTLESQRDAADDPPEDAAIRRELLEHIRGCRSRGERLWVLGV